ncbi:MAG: rhodanese-like domain-containing protein [Prevotella sp.]|nr:rhodanese-like domain-containing protein [Prevotella sp.]
MKKKIKALLLGLACSILGACAQRENIKSVSAEEFEQGIKADSVTVLDTRTAEEYAAGHINGAVNIDVLKNDFKSIATSTLPANRPVWVYCRSGRRSLTAAGILQKEGYKVVNLKGGIIEWEQKGKPVEK